MTHLKILMLSVSDSAPQYSEYFTEEVLEGFGNFQLGQVNRISGTVNYLLKGKEREGYK
jgi:hypothetical protein